MSKLKMHSKDITQDNLAKIQAAFPNCITKTLRPAIDERLHFDTTQNLFIEGDNLDALKLLQESYLGKVKMIYIDPPYNTSNDFVYNDNFAENAQAYLERSNQIDEEGNRLVANTNSNGRFHSDWLSMMYGRLKLSRNLLSDDGVIFISIGEDVAAIAAKSQITQITSVNKEVLSVLSPFIYGRLCTVVSGN